MRFAVKSFLFLQITLFAVCNFSCTIWKEKKNTNVFRFSRLSVCITIVRDCNCDARNFSHHSAQNFILKYSNSIWLTIVWGCEFISRFDMPLNWIHALFIHGIRRKFFGYVNKISSATQTTARPHWHFVFNAERNKICLLFMLSVRPLQHTAVHGTNTNRHYCYCKEYAQYNEARHSS